MTGIVSKNIPGETVGPPFSFEMMRSGFVRIPKFHRQNKKKNKIYVYSVYEQKPEKSMIASD